MFENGQKLSHSILRAKRAIFTFWVDKSWLKMPKMASFWTPEGRGQKVLPYWSILIGQNFIKSAKNGQFWKMRLFWWFSNTVSKVGWGWDVPKPICWLLSPHQLARWVDGIYAEMQCYQKLQQKCSVLEHQSFCLTSCIFILSEKEHLMFLQSTGQALFPLSAKPLWSRLESRYDHKVYHHAQWVKIP